MNSTRALTVGETVLIRAPVLAVFANCCEVSIGRERVSVPYDVVYEHDVDSAVAACRDLLGKMEETIQATLRAVSEVHDLGGKRMPSYSYSLLMPDPLGR